MAGVRAIRALPALVAVHRVVAAADGCNSLDGKLGEVSHGRVRRDVPPVREGVDPRALGHPLALGELEQRAQVVDVRVDAAVRDEPQQMDVGAALGRAPERRDERLVLEERPVLDGRADAHEVLEQDPAGAQGQVADLRVAHLARWQPDGPA